MPMDREYAEMHLTACAKRDTSYVYRMDNHLVEDCNTSPKQRQKPKTPDPAWDSFGLFIGSEVAWMKSVKGEPACALANARG